MTRWRQRYLSQLAVSLGIVLVWTLLGLFLARGAARQYRTVQKRLVEERAAQKDERKRLARLAEVKATNDTILQDIGAIEPTCARRLYQATLVQQLGQFAERSGVTLIGVTPDTGTAPAAGAKGLPDLPAEGPWRFVAIFTGRYNDVIKLIDALQTFPKAVSLQSVNLRVDKALRDGTMRAELGLLAREVPGVRDAAAMTTVPEVPASLMTKFDSEKAKAFLKSLEEGAAAEDGATAGDGAAGDGAVEAPEPGSLAPPPVGAVPPGSSAPVPPSPGVPTTGAMGSAPPAGPAPAGSAPPPGAAVTGGPAPTLPPGTPFRPQVPPRPDATAPAGGPPPPSTPNMLPGAGQSARPDALAPARSVANVGVVRRVYKVLRTDGLLPGGRPAVTDDGRVAATPTPLRGKTR